jgi:hypothetical protein
VVEVSCVKIAQVRLEHLSSGRRDRRPGSGGAGVHAGCSRASASVMNHELRAAWTLNVHMSALLVRL